METLVLGLRRWRPLFLVVVDHGPEVAEPHIGAGPIGWKQRIIKLAQKAWRTGKLKSNKNVKSTCWKSVCHCLGTKAAMETKCWTYVQSFFYLFRHLDTDKHILLDVSPKHSTKEKKTLARTSDCLRARESIASKSHINKMKRAMIDEDKWSEKKLYLEQKRFLTNELQLQTRQMLMFYFLRPFRSSITRGAILTQILVQLIKERWVPQ